MAQELRNRSFGGAARPQAQTQAAPKVDDLSWTASGDTARQQSAQEAEAAAARRAQAYQPRRFRLGVGQQADVIVLDYSIVRVPGTELTLQTQGIPSYHEHDLTWEPAFARNRTGSNSKQDIFEACPKLQETCPICRFLGKESGFIMLVSVLDARAITSQKTGITTPFRRNILAVKNEQQAVIHRIFDRAGGNPRGVHLLMTRDGQREAAIGKPEYVDTLTEQQLLEYFSHPAELAADGKVRVEANGMLQPYLYGSFLRRPTAADIHRKYPFLPAVAGSVTANERGSYEAPHNPVGGFNHSAGFQGASQVAAAQQAATGTGGGFAGRAANAKPPAQPDLDDEIPFN